MSVLPYHWGSHPNFEKNKKREREREKEIKTNHPCFTNLAFTGPEVWLQK